MGRQSSEAHVLEVCLNNLVLELDLEVCALSANTLPRASLKSCRRKRSSSFERLGPVS